ncbi:MAG: hydantoinase/oxoprolinase family protein [archaeon]|nr:hydantoinase/oxoprolinase family protein [archaeon]
MITERGMDTLEIDDHSINYGLGLDTGGTYTDAVIVDLSNGRIVCSSKSPTTGNDLSIGIAKSIGNFDRELFRNVKMVSLSSTLATNSIVEGKGCRVALITIGRDFDGSVPVDKCICIKGGHTLAGKEKEPLDGDAARNFLKSLEGRVDGVAISSYFSVRNPEHEKCIASLTREILDVPVVCGHELSSNLGFNERTTTCVMNARLIPIIKELVMSVKKVAKDAGIVAPLMIVKGDGSIMSESLALERPVETILSGPAASLIGAKTLTGRQNAIVMDIGGTTTDIGILRNGIPRLEKDGAIIGGRRTRVMAAEISTSGIGGDSRIIVNGNKLQLTALRVIPLCIAADRWPVLEEKLEVISTAPTRFVPEYLDGGKIIQEMEFFVNLKDNPSIVLTGYDKEFIDAIRSEPKSLTEVGNETGIHPYSFNVLKMEEFGIVQRIGLTPTDILHADGSYVQFNRKAAVYGVAHLANKLKISNEKFVKLAKQAVVDKIARELLKKLFYEETRHTRMDAISKDIMDKAISGKSGLDYGVTVKINKPVVGIGAPARAYLPQVVEKFGTELLLSEYSHVGSAVGAITGNVVESLAITITPLKGEGGGENPRCTLFASFGRYDFDKFSDALEFAKEEGSKVVSQRIRTAGADKFDVQVKVENKKFGFNEGYEGSVLIECNVTIVAVGKPKGFGFI